ncbi:MAG: hypothetical protein IPL83_05335 [Bdellovibrionales bacterium]|nr:hypothetical protein [Bdellovibrionales bacterium]
MFILFVLGLAAVWATLPSLLEPRIKELIITKGGELFEGEIVLGGFQLKSIIPISIAIEKLQITKSNGTLQGLVPNATIEIDFNRIFNHFPSLFFRTRVRIENPNLRILIPDRIEEAHAVKNPDTLGARLFKMFPIDSSVDLQISRGQVEVFLSDKSGKEDLGTRFGLKGLSLFLRQESLLNNKTPMDLLIQALLDYKSPYASFSMPVSVDSKEIFTSSGKLDVKRMNINLGGLLAAVAGTTEFPSLQQNWILKLQVPEISQIKVPPQFLPPGNWAGEISGKVHFAQKPSSPPYVAVQGAIHGLRGDTNFHRDEIQMNGAVAADARIDAVYSSSWEIKDLFVILDLSGASLRYLDWFQKKDSDRLRIEVQAKKEGSEFKIEKGDLEFTRLLSHVRGVIHSETNRQSFLEINVPPVRLDGFEAFFPFLKDQTLRGLLQVRAEVRGDLSQPENLLVKVSPLKIQDLSTTLNYSNDKRSIHVGGPLSVNADMELLAEGSHLKSAKAIFAAELSGMSMAYGDEFRKKKGDPLSLRATVNQAGDKIILQKFSFIHPAGSFAGSGEIENPQRPKFNIQADIEEVSFSRLSQVLPGLAQYGLNGGSLQGYLKARGVYDFALGISKSPISLVGEIKAQMAGLSIPIPKREEKKGGAPTVSHATVPFHLPSWPILAQSRLSFEAQVSKIKLGTEFMDRSNMKGSYDKGELAGEISIGGIFGGDLRVSSLKVFLLENQPQLKLKVDLNKFNLARVFNWWMPDRRDSVRGLLNIQGNFGIPFPGPLGWYEKIVSEGSISIKDFFASTLEIDKKINDVLAKLRTEEDKKSIDSKGVSAEVLAKFGSRDGQINLANFIFSTPENNQIVADGKVNFDLIGHLKGELRVSNLNTSGSLFAANADKEGRLVIPVEVQGSLINPGLTVASATIEKMLVKTIEYEKKKLVKKVEGKARQEFEKAVDEGKQKIEKDINEKIKGLFNRK